MLSTTSQTAWDQQSRSVFPFSLPLFIYLSQLSSMCSVWLLSIRIFFLALPLSFVDSQPSSSASPFFKFEYFGPPHFHNNPFLYKKIHKGDKANLFYLLVECIDVSHFICLSVVHPLQGLGLFSSLTCSSSPTIFVCFRHSWSSSSQVESSWCIHGCSVFLPDSLILALRLSVASGCWTLGGDLHELWGVFVSWQQWDLSPPVASWVSDD